MVDDRRLRNVAHWQDTVQMPTYASKEAWLERAKALRQQVLFAAGLLPAPERTPLNPVITGRVERDGYSVENVAFESMPGFFCTGNLYRPLGHSGSRPVVLTPHGHWKDGRFVHETNGSVPARSISFAQQGYFAFAPDMVGYNDSRQVPHRSFESTERWLWGIGALGLQLWNNIRALDFLLSLPEADQERVAVTGESGGATQTYLLAAVDDRVRVVAPVNMLSAHYAGGCVCENAPGLRIGVTNMELYAMAAPRPMLIVGATGDWTKNTPRVEFPAVQSIYRLLGAEDQLEGVQFDAPHNYNLDSRQAVYGFLARHLGGKAEPAPTSSAQVFRHGPSAPLREREDVTPEPRETRRIFPDGSPLPPGALPDADAVTAAIKKRALQRQAVPSRSGALREAWAREALSLLRLLLPVRQPAAPDLRFEQRSATDENGYTLERLTIASAQHGERLPAILVRPSQGTGVKGSVPVLLLDERGKRSWMQPDGEGLGPVVQKLVAAGRPALLVDLFLTGDFLSPFGAAGRPTGETHFTTYNLADAVWRAQDVLTAIAALRALAEADQVEVIAVGDSGLWALLARALTKDVRRLTADLGGFDWDDDADYLARLCIPHVRQVDGLAAAVGIAAPQPLVLFNAAGRVPDHVLDFYRTWEATQPGAGSLVVETGPLSDDQLVAG